MCGYIDFTIEEAVTASGGKFVGDARILCEKITITVIDSRQARKGSLFIALKGEKTDGYNYIPAAMENGAICAVTEREYTGFPCIVVPDAAEALQKIAATYRKKLNITVIGVTGSVGKTTTKELIAEVLSVKYRVVKTEGNFNNQLGLPLTVLSIKPDTEVAVIEMGMSNFGEMRLLSSIARPTMCVMTNIGISHIENLGSRENIFAAKSEVFESMPSTARCIFNGDDDLLSSCERPNKCLYGFDSDNDVYIQSFCEKGFSGTDFTVSLFGETVECHIPVPGRHMLFAAMAAMAAGSWLGLTSPQIAEGILNAKTISGRNNILKTDKYTVIDDSYNAAPQSVMSGIDTLIKSEEARTVCILGDMAELGSDAQALHYDVGQYAAKCKVGVVVAIGQLAKNIYSGAMENGGNAIYYETKEAFLKDAENILKKNDVILVKASHFMDFAKIVEELTIKSS